MDERLKVLRLLEEGKITAEDAERLLRAIHGLKSYSSKENLDTMEIHLKAANVRIVQKGDKLHADYDGYFHVEKREDLTIVKFSGDGEITIPEESILDLHIKAGNVVMNIKQDFRIYNKMGNAEITIEKPVNAEIKNRLGNVEITYKCEPSAEFEVKNNLGNVDIPEFKKGDKRVVIENKLGSVTIERR